ncbi:spore germination protein (plasmid) [Bacillus sp. CMF21]|nr:spore germination protein [Bacillus sp. CMF21]
MKSTEHPRFTISPYLVFVIIHSMQFGPEYLTMSNKLIQLAGQDTWISVILCGISFHIVIWMIYRILNRNETDQSSPFSKFNDRATLWGFIMTLNW